MQQQDFLANACGSDDVNPKFDKTHTHPHTKDICLNLFNGACKNKMPDLFPFWDAPHKIFSGRKYFFFIFWQVMKRTRHFCGQGDNMATEKKLPDAACSICQGARCYRLEAGVEFMFFFAEYWM